MTRESDPRGAMPSDGAIAPDQHHECEPHDCSHAGGQHAGPGGHSPIGWEFFLPNDHQGAKDSTGQKDWRFCSRCNGLFYAPAGQTTGTVCPAGGEHYVMGWVFYLPNDHQGANDSTGQRDWRYCGKCHGLFWAPGNQAAGSVCPSGGGEHSPIGWYFFLPNDHQGANANTGQGAWRYCGLCHGLFYNGYPKKGVCPGAK